MKKHMIMIALILVLVMVLSGCGGNTNTSKDPSTPDKQENSASQEPANPADQPSQPEQQPADQPAQPEQPSDQPTDVQPTVPTQSYQDTLMDRIPFSIDMGAGWEYRDLDVNGVFRRISVTFEMESSMISQDPCYTYYYVDIHGDDLWAEVVATGRAYLDDLTLSYVREYEAAGKRDEIFFTLFEDDFRASTFKGKDNKDYIVFSIPANWDPDSSTLVIATDQGKLLADSIINKSYQVTLEGDDTKRYMDSNGNANFFSFGEDHITYLKVIQTVDGVTTLREYSLEIDGDKITSVETGKIYTTADTVPDLAGLSIY